MSLIFPTLADVQVGDKVILDNGSHYTNSESIETVVRVTATQIVLKIGALETRYNKTTGHRCGQDGYMRSRISVATPDQLLRVRTLRRASFLRNKIDNVNWKELPLATLERVAAALELPEVAPVMPQQPLNP